MVIEERAKTSTNAAKVVKIMKIRAETLFIDTQSYKITELEETIKNFSEAITSLSEGFNIPVWTKRLALTPMDPTQDTVRIVDDLLQKIKGRIDFLAVPMKITKKDEIDIVVKVLAKDGSVYVSVTDEFTDLSLFERLLKEVYKNLGSVATTRVSLSLRHFLLTPYFPAATALDGEIGVAGALLYVSDLIKGENLRENIDVYILNAYNSAIGLQNELAKALKIKNYGLDLSYSPWMEESLTTLIEYLSGTQIGQTGTLDAISFLNKSLQKVINEHALNVTGYNEVMLPYGEDSGLMALGKQGLLDLYDFISFASVCVAGVDMIVLPKTDKIGTILRDIYAVLDAKKRTSGMRVVLTDANPLEIIELEKFGKVPVIKIKKS